MTKKGPVLNHDGEMMMTKQSFVAFRNADEVDGTIISEVKEGKDGISVKLHDKMKALEVLTKYLDLLPDNHKRMIEEEKLKLDRERLELDKAKAAGEGDLDEALIDDWVLAVMDDGTTKGGEKS
jgi:phage terminase small subunit